MVRECGVGIHHSGPGTRLNSKLQQRWPNVARLARSPLHVHPRTAEPRTGSHRVPDALSTIDKPNSSLQPPTDRSKIIFRTANEWAEPRVSLVGTSYNHHQPLYVDGFACQRCKTDIHRAEAEKYTPKGWGIPRPDLYEVRCLPRGRGVLEEVRFVGD